MELYDVTIKRFPDGTVRYSANYISNYYNSYHFTSELDKHSDDPIRSIKNSYKRTISQVSDLVHSNIWEYFFTLTFDKNYVDRYNYNACSELVHRFTDLIYKLGGVYIIVPERHKDGAWHFHGLLSGIPDNILVYNDNGYLSISTYKYGFSSIDRVRDTHRAGTYILKYMVKELSYQGIPKGKKRYWASRKLKRPIIDHNVIDISELDFLMSKAYYKREVQSDFYSGWIFEVLNDGKGKEITEDS